MRILLLVLQFPPDVNTTGLLMGQLCEGFVAAGHELTVMTSFPHYERFRIWPEYRGQLAQWEHARGMHILRLWVFASGRKTMLHRLLSYLSFNLLAVAAALGSRRPYDLILCPNGSFFSGLSAWLIGLVKRAPFIYNVQDLYPEVPVMAGQLRSRRAIAILEKLERFMYRRARHISVIAPSFRANLLGKGVPAAKISVIPNFVDTDFIRPLPRQNAFSRAHDLDARFVVMHAGNLGYVYDLPTLLEAAALLRGEPAIQFVIVGDGVAKAELQRQAESLQLRSVRFLPFQPHAQLPWLRATADVQLSLYKRGAGRYSLPSKVYEIMASARPLLASADRDSDVWQLVERAACGLCVEPGDAQQLADAIRTLYRAPALRAQLGERGRRAAEQHYARDSVVRHYLELFQRLRPPARAHSDVPQPLVETFNKE